MTERKLLEMMESLTAALLMNALLTAEQLNASGMDMSREKHKKTLNEIFGLFQTMKDFVREKT